MNLLLNCNEVAKRLNVSRPTLWRMRKSMSDFPKPIVISVKTIRFDEREVNAFIERHRANAESPLPDQKGRKEVHDETL